VWSYARVDVVWDGGGKASEVVDGSWNVQRPSQPDRLALVPRLGLGELVELCLEQVGDAQQ